MDFLNRLQPLALLLLRLVLGAIMIAHGYHKVFGGFHHHMETVASLGLPQWLAYLSAGTEFFGVLSAKLRNCKIVFPAVSDSPQLYAESERGMVRSKVSR